LLLIGSDRSNTRVGISLSWSDASDSLSDWTEQSSKLTVLQTETCFRTYCRNRSVPTDNWYVTEFSDLRPVREQPWLHEFSGIGLAHIA
jgi:hypothetical protein